MASTMRRVSEMVSSSLGDTLVNIKTWGNLTYNALEHGLVGDGETDDTAALQTLIDTAIAAGRKAIAFPHTKTGGEYYVTALTNADQVDFFGDNASFVGGYTGTINQLGDWATSEQLADLGTNVKKYGAIGDGETDDTEAIQNAIDASDDGVIIFPDTGSPYLVSKINIYNKGSEEKSFSLIFLGQGLISSVGEESVAIDIQSCKRLFINGLVLQNGTTSIKGLYDSNFKDCHLRETSFGGTSDVEGGFTEHFWNYFERVRFGPLTFTLHTDSTQHYTNQNTFASCICEGFAITGNDTGQFQGNNWVSGEIRHEFTVDAENTNGVPNGLTIFGTYFDQANTESDIFDFEISQVGVNPEVNTFSLDGQKVSTSGVTQQLSQYGPKSGRRFPASGVNFCLEGDLNDLAAGESASSGLSPSRTSVNVTVNSGDGLNGKYMTIAGANTFGTAEFKTTPLPFTGTYTATTIYRKPTGDTFSVRLKNITQATDAYSVLAQNSPIRDEWIVGSYTFKATAGDIVSIVFYLGSSYSGFTIDVAYAGVSLGGHSLINLPTAPVAKNQKKTRWRSAVPTTGTWAQGDIIFNTAPSASGKIGWVCTAAGTPGTWKTWGAIDA